MDCSKNQTCSGIRRPQIPEPPCRSTGPATGSSSRLPWQNTNGADPAFGGQSCFGMPGNVLPLRPGMATRPQPNTPPFPAMPPKPNTPPAPAMPPVSNISPAPTMPPTPRNSLTAPATSQPRNISTTPAASQARNALTTSAATQAQQNTPSGNSNVDSMPYAMSYVPSQSWNQTYSLEQGLERGTIFPDLDLPFTAGRRRRK